LDLKTHLRSVEVLHQIYEVLPQCQTPSIDIETTNKDALSRAVRDIGCAVSQPSITRVPAE
jgi:hypothetical protein